MKRREDKYHEKDSGIDAFWIHKNRDSKKRKSAKHVNRKTLNQNMPRNLTEVSVFESNG